MAHEHVASCSLASRTELKSGCSRSVHLGQLFRLHRKDSHAPSDGSQSYDPHRLVGLRRAFSYGSKVKHPGMAGRLATDMGQASMQLGQDFSLVSSQPAHFAECFSLEMRELGAAQKQPPAQLSATEIAILQLKAGIQWQMLAAREPVVPAHKLVADSALDSRNTTLAASFSTDDTPRSELVQYGPEPFWDA
eukprot:710569-Pleurochrysis_carterae.AAC.2